MYYNDYISLVNDIISTSKKLGNPETFIFVCLNSHKQRTGHIHRIFRLLADQYITTANSGYMLTSLTWAVKHYKKVINDLLIFHTVLPCAVT